MVTENRPHFPDLARVFEKIIEEANEAIYLHTLDPDKPNFIMVNREACQMLGYYRDELLERGPAAIDSPRFAAKVPERVRELLAKGRLTFESEHVTKEGLVIPVEITASVVEFFGQKYILSFARDITDRLNLQKILHRSEDRFRRLSDMAPIGIFFLDHQGKMIYVNQQLIYLSGLGFDEFLGEGWKKIVYVDDREQLERKLSESIGQGRGLSLEFRIVGPDSKIHWTSIRVSPMPGDKDQVNGFVGIVEDITSLKLMHDLLTDKVIFIQQLIEAMPNPVFYKDTDLKYVGCNKAFEEMLGVSQEQIIGRSVYDLWPKDLADKYSQMDNELLKNPGAQVYESRVQNKNGLRRQVVFYRATYKDPKGALAGIIGVIIDITERKAVEAALAKAAQEWSVTFDAMADGVSLHGPDYTILKVNKTLCQLLNKTKEELVGKKCYEIFHGRTSPLEGCPLEQAKHSIHEEHAELFEPLLNRWIAASVSPVLDKDGKITNMVHIVRDITKQKQAAEELQKQVKELEIFNKVTLEREKRIIELKQKIKELEQKLSERK